MKKKYKNILIKGKKIYLRPLTMMDVNKEYLSWLNDKNNTRHRYFSTAKNTKTSLKNFVYKKIKDPNTFFFAIIDIQSNTHVGNIKLETKVRTNGLAKKNAIFGRLMGHKNFKSKGYGTEATKLILKFSFKTLKLYKVCAGCMASNIGAIKSNTKNGMKIESRKKINIRNRSYNMVQLGIVKKDWKKINKHI
tara:strand:- start:7066 stop:7641 length:576 start_codon:yes stop_codon:yes gene_type:complete